MFYFFSFLFYILIQLINNVVVVSGVKQSDSVLNMYVSILFKILFPFKLLCNTEQSSLCYTIGPCWLSILNIAVASLVAQRVKASACNVGDQCLIPGSGRSPGEGNVNPLQYSCLENPMDGGASQATVHGVAKSQT